MIHSQNAKYVKITTPVSVSAGALTSASVDTQGYDYCTIFFMGGAMATGYSVLKVQESDTDGSFADFSNDNGVFGYGETDQLNVDGSAAGDPDATNDVLYVFEIDLKGRKRYLDLAGTAGGTCLSAAWAMLTRADDPAPDTLATRGMTGGLRA